MILLLSSFIYKSIAEKGIEVTHISDALANIGADIGQVSNFEESKNIFWNGNAFVPKNITLSQYYVNFHIENNTYVCNNDKVKQFIDIQAKKNRNISMYDACFNNDFVISLALTPNINHLSCVLLLAREIALYMGYSSNHINSDMALPRIVSSTDDLQYHKVKNNIWNALHHNIRAFHISNSMQITIEDDFINKILSSIMNCKIEKVIDQDEILLKAEAEKINSILPYCLSAIAYDYNTSGDETMNALYVDRKLGRISLNMFKKYFSSLPEVVVAMHNKGININRIGDSLVMDMPALLSANNEMQYIEEIYRNYHQFNMIKITSQFLYRDIEDIYIGIKNVLLSRAFKEVCSLPFSHSGSVLCDNPCDNTKPFLRNSALLSFIQHMRDVKNENIFQQGTLFFPVDDVIYSPRFVSICEIANVSSILDTFLFYISSQCLIKAREVTLISNEPYIALNEEKNAISVCDSTIYLSRLPLFIYTVFSSRKTIFKCLEINTSLLSQLHFNSFANMFISRSDLLGSSFELVTLFFDSIKEYLQYLINMFNVRKIYAEVHDAFFMHDKIKITLKVYNDDRY